MAQDDSSPQAPSSVQIGPKHLLLTFLIALALGSVGTYIVVNQNWVGEVERQRAANAEQTAKLQQNYDSIKSENQKLIDKSQKLVDGIKKSFDLTSDIGGTNADIGARTRQATEILKQVKEILTKFIAENE